MKFRLKSRPRMATQRLAWMLTFVPGTMLAEVRPHSEELLKSLGRLLGQIDSALQDFSHPAAQRELKWDLSAPGWIRKHLHAIADVSRRSLVEKFLAFYESEIVPGAAESPTQRYLRRCQRSQRAGQRAVAASAASAKRHRFWRHAFAALLFQRSPSPRPTPCWEKKTF